MKGARKGCKFAHLIKRTGRGRYVKLGCPMEARSRFHCLPRGSTLLAAWTTVGMGR